MAHPFIQHGNGGPSASFKINDNNRHMHVIIAKEHHYYTRKPTQFVILFPHIDLPFSAEQSEPVINIHITYKRLRSCLFGVNKNVCICMFSRMKVINPLLIKYTIGIKTGTKVVAQMDITDFCCIITAWLMKVYGCKQQSTVILY